MKTLNVMQVNEVNGGSWDAFTDIMGGGLKGAAIGGRLGAFGGPAGAALGITYGFLGGMVITAYSNYAQK